MASCGPPSPLFLCLTLFAVTSYSSSITSLRVCVHVVVIACCFYRCQWSSVMSACHRTAAFVLPRPLGSTAYCIFVPCAHHVDKSKWLSGLFSHTRLKTRLVIAYCLSSPLFVCGYSTSICFGDGSHRRAASYADVCMLTNRI